MAGPSQRGKGECVEELGVACVWLFVVLLFVYGAIGAWGFAYDVSQTLPAFASLVERARRAAIWLYRQGRRARVQHLAILLVVFVSSEKLKMDQSLILYFVLKELVALARGEE